MNMQIILNQQTPKVENISDVSDWINKNDKLIDAFLGFCFSNNDRAVGLAANQLSVNGERLAAKFFGHKVANSKTNEWECIIDPKIISYVGEPIECNERCLTWPNKVIPVKRYPQILVSYWLRDKTFCNNVVIRDFEAQVWQHETDHLNGIKETLIASDEKTYRRETPKIGRNEICACGSGKKSKRCCLLKEKGAS